MTRRVFESHVTKCPECNHQIKSWETVCPQCGVNIKKTHPLVEEQVEKH